MTRILFVCLGNICRSPMAELVMRDMVRKAGLDGEIEVSSAGTSAEELGNPVYPPVRRLLEEHGIDSDRKTARRMTPGDYGSYDLLIGMEESNLQSMRRLCGGDPDGKLHLLLEYAGRQGGIADPWYTRDFEAAWRDVNAGCKGLLEQLQANRPGTGKSS